MTATLIDTRISQPELEPAILAFDLPEKSLGDFHSMMKDYMWNLESSITIQQNLLPKQPPKMAGTDVAVRYLPMMGVSGDYYDFLPLGEDQMALTIGDVCGKGMKAAPLMASVCASLRTQVGTGMEEAGELMKYLNRDIQAHTPNYQFVTLAYGILDSSSYVFTYSSAGHPPVLHYQAATGNVRKLDAGGIVLGICEEAEYPMESVSLEIGDALVFYTDGIIEARSENDEIFGISRLSKAVAKYGDASSEAMASAILETAEDFA